MLPGMYSRGVRILSAQEAPSIEHGEGGDDAPFEEKFVDGVPEDAEEGDEEEPAEHDPIVSDDDFESFMPVKASRS